MVYRITFDRDVLDRNENVIAIYSRREGATLRVKQLASANPGVLFASGWIPEGVKPEWINITRVDFAYSVLESEVPHAPSK
jgi:hypothetical protein